MIAVSDSAATKVKELLEAEGDTTLAVLSVQSPAVSVEESFGRQAAAVAGYDEDDDSY